ncbi:MAG: hypothetical protein FRX49_11390 [Trebouxia sp. A1-2]|nr:MAG: hypothetical protein FRX49_11390 [Trebouxia sp. A1-2]
MLASWTHRCLPLQTPSHCEQRRVRQLLQSDYAQWGIEERRKLRHDNATSQNFAVTAIERAQLRHRLRLQRSSSIESQHSTVDLDTSYTGMRQAEYMFFTITTLKQQCHSQPLLSRDEEMDLALTMAEETHLGFQLKSLQQQEHAALSVLPSTNQHNLTLQAILQRLHAAQVRGARRRLTQANLHLVLKVVLAYSQQKQVDMQDLVQAGMYGLGRGLDKYDPSRGSRVSTVAYMWVKEAVGRVYNESARTIIISERTLTNMRKIAAAQEQQQGALASTAASADQLQQLTGLSNPTFASTMKACKLRERSLEAAIESGSASGKEHRGSSPLDQICNNINHDSCAAMDSSANAAECLINGALQQLPDAEARVLDHVYGLQDGLPKSRRQEQIPWAQT